MSGGTLNPTHSLTHSPHYDSCLGQRQPKPQVSGVGHWGSSLSGASFREGWRDLWTPTPEGSEMLIFFLQMVPLKQCYCCKNNTYIVWDPQWFIEMMPLSAVHFFLSTTKSHQIQPQHNFCRLMGLHAYPNINCTSCVHNFACLIESICLKHLLVDCLLVHLGRCKPWMSASVWSGAMTHSPLSSILGYFSRPQKHSEASVWTCSRYTMLFTTFVSFCSWWCDWT